MKIQILVDNPSSWFVPYAEKLLVCLNMEECDAKIVFSHEDVERGDLLVLLSCEKKFKKLSYNKHNIVVHSSDLPQGKGWSPITWQVLENKNVIRNTLFEAADSIDAGDIYLQNDILLDGFELIDEIKNKQANAIIELVLQYVSSYEDIVPRKQEGIETFYSRRSKGDSKLDIDKTIREQFNLLRVCDNERYPAYFEIEGHFYYIKIYKQS